MRLVCLHNVIAEEPDAFDRRCSRISQEEFSDFLDNASTRFQLLSFSEFLQRYQEKRWAEDGLSLSFDDGFLGVHRYAFPILQKRGLNAALFINPVYAESPRYYIFHFLEIEIAFRLTRLTSLTLPYYDQPLSLNNEDSRIRAMKIVKRILKATPEAQRQSYHSDLLRILGVSPAEIQSECLLQEKYALADVQQIQELRQWGWSIGSHSISHRTLGMLSPEETAHEIASSKEKFESLLGIPDRIFAYPYGQYNHVGDYAPLACKAAGYQYAFTTVPGDYRTQENPFLLHRYDYKVFNKEFLS